MRVAVRVRKEASGYVADAESPECCAEGRTRAEALERLRVALSQQLEPQAVAPPADAHAPPIEMIVEDV